MFFTANILTMAHFVINKNLTNVTFIFEYSIAVCTPLIAYPLFVFKLLWHTVTAEAGPLAFITKLSNGNTHHYPDNAIQCHTAKCLFSLTFLLTTADTVIAMRLPHFLVRSFLNDNIVKYICLLIVSLVPLKTFSVFLRLL